MVFTPMYTLSEKENQISLRTSRIRYWAFIFDIFEVRIPSSRDVFDIGENEVDLPAKREESPIPRLHFRLNLREYRKVLRLMRSFISPWLARYIPVYWQVHHLHLLHRDTAFLSGTEMVRMLIAFLSCTDIGRILRS